MRIKDFFFPWFPKKETSTATVPESSKQDDTFKTWAREELYVGPSNEKSLESLWKQKIKHHKKLIDSAANEYLARHPNNGVVKSCRHNFDLRIVLRTEKFTLHRLLSEYHHGVHRQGAHDRALLGDDPFDVLTIMKNPVLNCKAIAARELEMYAVELRDLNVQITDVITEHQKTFFGFNVTHCPDLDKLTDYVVSTPSLPYRWKKVNEDGWFNVVDVRFPHHSYGMFGSSLKRIEPNRFFILHCLAATKIKQSEPLVVSSREPYGLAHENSIRGGNYLPFSIRLNALDADVMIEEISYGFVFRINPDRFDLMKCMSLYHEQKYDVHYA